MLQSVSIGCRYGTETQASARFQNPTEPQRFNPKPKTVNSSGCVVSFARRTRFSSGVSKNSSSSWFASSVQGLGSGVACGSFRATCNLCGHLSVYCIHLHTHIHIYFYTDLISIYIYICMYLFTDIYIYLFVYLSIYLFMFIYLFLCLFIHLSISTHMCMCIQNTHTKSSNTKLQSKPSTFLPQPRLRQRVHPGSPHKVKAAWPHSEQV